ncbi:hypothetical protein [Viridibacillus arvi]|uniref:hypothetical protein n=1 Tax=Viridibacillus arvi TaxID=263475 RepID=UPI0034CEE132
MDKQERVEIVNSLIKFISDRGGRYFYKKDTLLRKNANNVAYMKLKGGRVYFVDDWTEQDVYAYPNGKDRDGFSHGGTLWALICDFGDFIRNGGNTNGSHGYGGLYSEYWGYDDQSIKEVIAYAKEIGYLKGE